MPAILSSICSFLLLVGWTGSFAAGPENGSVIVGYGPVFPAASEVFNLKNDHRYKVSKDVSTSDEDYSKLNRGFESAARFLNMQASSGTKLNQLDMAVVVHGMAAKDLLTDAAYPRMQTAGYRLSAANYYQPA
jgi:hypothetical protein